jgi:hypothetical protein
MFHRLKQASAEQISFKEACFLQSCIELGCIHVHLNNEEIPNKKFQAFSCHMNS